MRQILFFILFNFCINKINFSQTLPDCVHGGGVQLQYLMDAMHASIFGCNCLPGTVYKTNMPDCEDKGNYILVFEDNFDTPILDPYKWKIQPWGQGALEGDPIQEYNSLNNISISSGICHITAKKETVVKRALSYCPSQCVPCNTEQDVDNCHMKDGQPNLRTYNYTSSNIWTTHRFFHGKYEIKCKLPFDKGFWPAFWLYGDGASRANEIDIFDNYKGSMETVTATWHDFDGDGKTYGCNNTYNNLDLPTGYDFTKWHTYTCFFENDRIIWQIDNNTIRTMYRYANLSNEIVYCGDDIAQGEYYQQKSFPLESMCIILNLAVKSGSDVPDDSQFPATFDIDYVRMWEFGPALPACDGTDVTVSTIPVMPFISPAISAFNSIVTSGNVLVALPTDWTAGNSIELNDGFETKTGVEFTAEIAPCDNSEGRLVVNTNSTQPSVLQEFIPALKNTSAQAVYQATLANNNDKFSVIPNPSTGNFLLTIDDGQSGGQKEILIYNPLGQIAYQQVINSTTQQIDLSSQPKGIYFVKVQTVDKVYARKVVVQ